MKFALFIFVRLFARPRFQKLNTTLLHLGLRGLGILNYQNDELSGESYLVRKVLPRLVTRKAPVFVDVGANVGKYSSLLLTNFPNAYIHAFEPHPKNFAHLASKHPTIERLKCYNLGLGEKTTTAILYDRADSDGSSHASLHEAVITEIHKMTAVTTSIQIDSLDRIAARENIDYIDYLKIDTEGNELSVLKGASRLLSTNKIGCIQFEFNEMNVASRVFFSDFRKLLIDYDLFRLLPHGMIRLGDTPLGTELFAYQNIVAIKKNP